MQYLEYKMDMGPGGMHTPHWVDSGGFWHNPANHTMVGATRDNPEFVSAAVPVIAVAASHSDAL